MISVDRLLSGAPPSTLDKPLEHLQACHRRIEDRLAALERAGIHFETDPAEAFTVIENSLAFFRRNGVLHTEDEENSVFPRLLPLLNETEAEFVTGLEDQHQEAAGMHQEVETAVEALRNPARRPEALSAYRLAVARLTDFYRAHIRMEDTRLTPLAQRLLTCVHLKEISTEMRARRSNT